MANPINNILLLGCLLHHRPLMQTAVVSLGEYSLFDPVTDRAAAFLWEVIKQLYKLNSIPPTETFLRAELEQRLQIQGDNALRHELGQLLAKLYSLDGSDLPPQLGQVLLEDAMVQAAKISWVEQIRQTQTLGDLKTQAKRLTNDLNQTGIRRSAQIKPLFNLESLLKARERTGFEVPFWDACGGCYAPGERHGLLGPTGGGKTVLAVSVLCGQAKAGRHVAMFTYEQPAEGDVTERICTHMADEPIGVFRDKPYGELPPEVKLKLTRASALLGQYVSLFDLTQDGHGFGGAGEVTGHCDQMIKAGEKPGLVIIDWFGAMVDRNAIGDDRVVLETRYRTLAPRLIDELGIYGRETGISFLILHQLSTKACERKPGIKPQKTDAHEMKSFPFMMDTCSCIGTMNKAEKVCWFVPDKSRRSDAPDTIIKLLGEHQRFIDVQDDYAPSQGDLVPKSVPDPDDQQKTEEDRDGLLDRE